MSPRLALWLALILASGSLVGCGGGLQQEGAPADNPGYVDPASLGDESGSEG